MLCILKNFGANVDFILKKLNKKVCAINTLRLTDYKALGRLSMKPQISLMKWS